MCQLCNYYSNWQVKEGIYEANRVKTLEQDCPKEYAHKGDTIEDCIYLNCNTCKHPNNPGRLETIVEELNCIKSDCPILKEE